MDTRYTDFVSYLHKNTDSDVIKENLQKFIKGDITIQELDHQINMDGKLLNSYKFDKKKKIEGLF